jgi:hypothetical protein
MTDAYQMSDQHQDIRRGRRLSGKKSARGADLGTSQSLLRVEHYGLRDRQMAVIESCSEVED